MITAIGDSSEDDYGLTSEERAIVRLMTEGWTNSVIAQRLGIDEATVRRQVKSIFGKLGVETRIDAILKLYRQ